MDNAALDGLAAEHGLSFHVRNESTQGLFDTGQSDQLASNAYQLGIPLAELDWVVLSHGHYDHTGGLACALQQHRGLAVYAHPDAFQPKYSKQQSGEWRDIGFAQKSLMHSAEGELHVGRTPQNVASGIGTTGEIPLRSGFESPDAGFRCRRCTGTGRDMLHDDQALAVETGEGWVALLGCAHRGLINSLMRLSELTGSRKFRAVAGGFHLSTASEAHISRTMDALQAFEVDEIVPAHCTGEQTVVALKSVYNGKCRPAHAGLTLEY
jgi:7,8-dihydropterin-6-yl-methyl-4-(beta-D-ribofuranosyl)aminobenzene 5'-phosphate synthase